MSVGTARANRLLTITAVLAVCLLGRATPGFAQAVETKVVPTSQGFQLLRGGKPYFVMGGGGDGPKNVLAECGGNSFRTWSVGGDTLQKLNEAQKLGLSVTLGIWIDHKDKAYWDDLGNVKKEIEKARQAVSKFKDHPAVLCWAFGNEMETGGGDCPNLWKTIEAMAQLSHTLDPYHPTMTVIAELGKKPDSIKQYCPNIDIVGVNTYGRGPSVGERFRKANVGKPYIVTEYGPAGTWESGRNGFGAAIELTSTEKAKAYQATYVKSVAGQPGYCLGSYAFTWGFKNEATATWFGLFLPDNAKLEGVDMLAELWSGKPPAHRCPQITKLGIVGSDRVNPGEPVHAAVEGIDPGKGMIQITWTLLKERASYGITGAGEKGTADFSSSIVKNGQPTVDITAPAAPGIYRLYCFIHNGPDSAACGSLPILVGPAPDPKGKPKK